MNTKSLPVGVPKNVGESKITVGDLEKTLTVEQALELVDHVVSEVRSSIEATIEHWSDGKGLHWTPFQKDLDTKLPELTDSEVLYFLMSERIV